MPQNYINEVKAAVSGSILLFDPSTIAGADGANVTAVTDQSSNGTTIAVPAGTKPVIKRNPEGWLGRDAMRMNAVTSSGLTLTGLTIPDANCTFVCVCKPDRVAGLINYTMFGGGVNTLNIYYRNAINRLTVYDGSIRTFGPSAAASPTTFSGAGGVYQGLNDINIMIMRGSGGTTAWRGYLNGESTTASKTNIADVTTAYIGQSDSGANPFAGDIYFAGIWNIEMTTQNVTDIAAILRTAFPTTPQPKGRSSFYFMGDSISYGNYASVNANRWPRKALDQATAIPADYRRAFELTVPSITLAALNTIFAASGGFKTFMPSDAANSIAVIMAGTNDIALSPNQSGATTNTRCETLATSVKTYNANAKVVALTMIPRTGVTTVRDDCNTLLMANTTLISGALYSKAGGSPIDYIIAVHLDAAFDADADSANATNYDADAVHPNNTGHGVIAGLVDDALEYLYALSSGSAPTVTSVAVADGYCAAGGTANLSATVSVTGGAAQTVTWEVASGSGSINASTGVFDATGLSAGETAVVRARSGYDPYFYDDATITVSEIVAPTFLNANVNAAGTTLTVNFTEATSPSLLPATGATGFTLSGGHTLASGVRQTNTQYTFAITGVVLPSETVTVSYSGGNVTDSAGVPNALATFSTQAVTNNSTVDAVAPTFLSASINAAGDTLTVNFTEAGSPPLLPATGATGFTLSGGHALANGVRQTNTQYAFAITGQVYQGDVLTVSYSGGNVTDSAGSPNSLSTFSTQAVTNNSTVSSDATAPTLATATVQASGLTTILTLSETCTYASPAAGHWALTIGGSPVAVSGAAFGSNQITLTHAQIYTGQSGTVAFTEAANRIEDTAGNDMVTQTIAISANNSAVPDPNVTTNPDPTGIEGLASLLTRGGNILSRLPRGG